MDNRFSNWYNIIDQNIQPIKQIFDQFYLGDGVVLDVGGNVGAFTDYVISKYPNSEIHIFEPVEKFKDFLKEKIIQFSIQVKIPSIARDFFIPIICLHLKYEYLAILY